MANTIRIGLAEGKTLSPGQADDLLRVLWSLFGFELDGRPQGVLEVDNDRGQDEVRDLVAALEEEDLLDTIEFKALTYVHRGSVYDSEGDMAALLSVKGAGRDLKTYEFNVDAPSEAPRFMTIDIDVMADSIEAELEDAMDRIMAAKAALAWEPTGFPAK